MVPAAAGDKFRTVTVKGKNSPCCRGREAPNDNEAFNAFM